MRGYRGLLIILSGLIGWVGGTIAGEPQARSSQPLTDQQINTALDQIFAQQKKLTRLQARVISRKTGGIFSGSSAATVGDAFAQMPDLLFFTDYGETDKNTSMPNYILIDGTYLWDMKPGADDNYEAERMALKDAGDRDLNIASLLIGATVNNSQELREFYEVSGTVEDFGAAEKSYHFRFKTLPDKSKNDKNETSELWIKAGEVIPWYLKVSSQVKKTDVFSGETTYKTAISEKEFSQVRTNLSNPPLPPLPITDIFYIGQLLMKHRGTKVIDQGKPVANAQLTSELKVLLSRLQEKQQAK